MERNRREINQFSRTAQSGWWDGGPPSQYEEEISGPALEGNVLATRPVLPRDSHSLHVAGPILQMGKQAQSEHATWVTCPNPRRSGV